MSPKNRSVRRPFINKFYCGATHIAKDVMQNVNNVHTHPTAADAIAQARQHVEGGKSECEIVVQIIAIVKRQKPPVTVEKV
jgi:hypothetical protein